MYKGRKLRKRRLIGRRHIYKLISPFTYLYGLVNPQKEIPADIYVISYPKSGRTWLRVILGRIICMTNNIPEAKLLDTEFITSDSGLPRTRFIHDDSDTSLQKGYDKIRYSTQKYENSKVLFLTRDIKDILVSAYFQVTKRELFFEGGISDFIRDKRYGALKIINFYKHWYDSREVPRSFIHLTYEQMHSNIFETSKRAINFIGLKNVDDEIISSAISYAAFDKMKKYETVNKFNSPVLQANYNSDPESFKTRKGVVGGYKDYLSKEDIEYVDMLIEKEKQNCDFIK